MTGILTAAAPSPGGSYLPYVVGIIVALLGGGGLAALLKTGREGSRIVVDAAQGAVVVQSGVIGDLRDQLIDAQRQITEMRGHLTELGLLREENRMLRGRQAQLEQENAALSKRVAELERA
jgi:hypothetical protein